MTQVTTVRLSLLDRLIDDEPEQLVDRPISAAQALTVLRRSVLRDLEALMNTRRRWRSWAPSAPSSLSASPTISIPRSA